MTRPATGDGMIPQIAPYFNGAYGTVESSDPVADVRMRRDYEDAGVDRGTGSDHGRYRHHQGRASRVAGSLGHEPVIETGRGQCARDGLGV
jgi:hypothetical protein